MYSVVTSGAVRGIASYLIRVEIDCTEGLPFFSMVGFAGTEVREAGERVRVAMRNAGYGMDPRRITVNLAPANIPKRGIVIDLPVAVGLLVSEGAVPLSSVGETLVLGELGLNGEIRPVRGVLAIVKLAMDSGVPLCILPMDNLAEAHAITGVRCAGVRTLRELVAFMNLDPAGKQRVIQEQKQRLDNAAASRTQRRHRYTDLSAVKGQAQAKRALEIAAAGYHNLYMSGPPGSGKSLLASCLPGLMPSMSEEECMEVSSVYSVAGRLPEDGSLIRERPFVAPHHTVTRAALIGGGSSPGPGAISLAHNGVLFLDEMPEFGRIRLDLLRQPMEEREIRITRSYGTFRFPARFLLAGAGNPCICGRFPSASCTCTESQLRMYRQRISGPLMDRMDIRLHVTEPRISELQGETGSSAAGGSMSGDDIARSGTDDTLREESPVVRQRVEEAAARQRFRYADTGISFNAELSAEDTARYCRLGSRENRFMRQLLEGRQISARAYHRILRVARTIADLDGAEEIREDHLAEACLLRGTEDRDLHMQGGRNY